jgi:RimJ/RimL family protein N-acetyltransferase
VRAVTSPQNERSIAFHQAFGFEVEGVDGSSEAPAGVFHAVLLR